MLYAHTVQDIVTDLSFACWNQQGQFNTAWKQSLRQTNLPGHKHTPAAWPFWSWCWSMPCWQVPWLPRHAPLQALALLCCECLLWESWDWSGSPLCCPSCKQAENFSWHWLARCLLCAVLPSMRLLCMPAIVSTTHRFLTCQRSSPMNICLCHDSWLKQMLPCVVIDNYSRLSNGLTSTLTAVCHEMLVFAVSLHEGVKCSTISQCKWIVASWTSQSQCTHQQAVAGHASY